MKYWLENQLQAGSQLFFLLLSKHFDVCSPRQQLGTTRISEQCSSFCYTLGYITSEFFYFYFQAAAAIKDGKRILFQFDKAAFSFKFLPFKVPYPVPFRLLGDEAKGWLDTTYLSTTGNLRISRGNKVSRSYMLPYSFYYYH